MALLVLLLGLSFVSSSWTATTQNRNANESSFPISSSGETFPWNKMRLPQSVSPFHYSLLIHPNLSSLDISGSVKIRVDILQDTHTVILHSKELNISRAGVRGLAEGQSQALRVLEYPAYQQIALVSEDMVLRRGNVYVIELEFAAKLSESFHGFYKSTYRTSDGEERVLASTQFEPTSARAAFPCFDEPAFKANFSIQIRRESRHITVSNMPKLRTLSLSDGLFEDQFDDTVKMSTYLVAFIVCDFLSISKQTQHGVQISVYTVPEKIKQAEFALDAAVRLLDFYDDYFDIPYPLPKHDLAAIPDFQSGAMENWGLTTYRESALLFDRHKSSASDKLGITMIIAHELAHQWFGNLVTMQWWNDLWLNEGFAKFMEFVSVNITNPELQVVDYFLGKCFQAMEVDCFSSSHPMSSPVENPAQIQEMFDDVSYDKKQHSENKVDVRTMMDTWTLQEGFPLITVEVRGREVRLNVLYLPEEVNWIKFNVDMSGYYMVHYEGSGWGDLISLLKRNHTALSSKDRTSLINNAFQLVSVDKLPLDKALDLSLYLSQETEIMPVTQGFSELVPLYKLMEKRDTLEVTENQMKSYILHLFRKLIDQQVWTDDGSVSQRMLRSYLLLFACVRGHAHCTATASKLFEKWKESDGKMSLPNDVSLAVFLVGALTEEGWNFLFEKYRETLYSSLKIQIKSALSISPLAHKLKWMMEQSLEGSVMKTQDLPYVVVSVSKNPKGYKHAWDFLRANWNSMVKKFDLGSASLAHMVIGVTNQYSTTEKLEEIRSFFGSLSAEMGSELRCIQQALENVEENIRWMDKNLPLLQAWLEKNNPEPLKRYGLHTDL
ncbi:Endoplasmic reticulum aminopeptidase 1 [Bagarius yarrelli]|uniref:Aminopeptidase n=1 Tax=Bagarius yarrelli TaxID=175774 RepID=A0A556V0W3_BAGYA|nr:Endoplasmic reticulum aminopeptidase 1 [Bagarius yarrelli]